MKPFPFYCNIFFTLLLIYFQPAKGIAQYDGSFEYIFFDRSYSAQSAALGRISTPITDDAFSVHYNSALLSFQNEYTVSFSHTSPFYRMKNANFNYYGITAPILDRFSLGVGHLDLKFNASGEQKLSTLAFVYEPVRNFSIGANLRRLYLDIGYRSDVTGRSLGEIVSKRIYFGLSSSIRIPHKSLIAPKSILTLGATFDNIFQQSIGLGSRGSSNFELPSVLTLGAANKFIWRGLDNGPLIKRISFNLLAEYQNVLNYQYKTRLSLGTQLGLNRIVMLRVGYFFQTTNDFGAPINKSRINAFTYGVGVNVPFSEIIKLDETLILSLNFTRLQQPLFTNKNLWNIGKFSTFSGSVRLKI